MKTSKIVTFLLILALSITGCSTDTGPANEDFIGMRLSTLPGSAFIDLFKEHYGEAIPVYCDTNIEKLELVNSGHADAALLDEPIARKLLTRYDNLIIIKPGFTHDDYGIAFSNENKQLRDNFNMFLAQLKDSGVYDDLIKRWFDTETSPALPDIPLTGAEGILIFATTGATDSVSYMQDGKLAGFDVEIAMRFAQYMEMALEFSVMEFGELLSAVSTGKADFAGSLITITDARRELVSFSDAYYVGGGVLVTKKTE